MAVPSLAVTVTVAVPTATPLMLKVALETLTVAVVTDDELGGVGQTVAVGVAEVGAQIEGAGVPPDGGVLRGAPCLPPPAPGLATTVTFTLCVAEAAPSLAVDGEDGGADSHPR